MDDCDLMLNRQVCGNKQKNYCVVFSDGRTLNLKLKIAKVRIRCDRAYQSISSELSNTDKISFALNISLVDAHFSGMDNSKPEPAILLNHHQLENGKQAIKNLH